mgnify:CR=1 FL=1
MSVTGILTATAVVGVVGIFVGLFLVAVPHAGHEGHLSLRGPCLHAHDGRDLLPHGSAAHGTGVHWSLPLGYGRGQAAAARIAAASAVVSRKRRRTRDP